MIPGCGANGQFPNLSLGLPIAKTAKSAVIKVVVRKQGNIRIQPTKSIRLANYPKV